MFSYTCDGVGYVDGGQVFATIKRFITDTRDGVRNVDGGQAAARVKRIITDTRDGVGDGDGGQLAAPAKRRTTDTRDGVGDRDRGQAAARVKRMITNTLDGVGYVDGGQAAAFVKRIITDTRDGVGDDCILTSGNYCIGFCFDNSITVVAAVINWIVFAYLDVCQAAAIAKRRITDTRNGVGDFDGGQAAATVKRTASYT